MQYRAIILDINVAYLFIIAVAGANIYGLVIAGWASNSRYPLLGAIRACGQLLSYELIMGLVLLCVFLQTHSMNLTQIVLHQAVCGWLVFYMVPLFVI